MSTSLTGSSAGDLWHRLGELEGALLDALSYQGGSTTSNIGSSPQLTTRLSAWVTDFLSNGTVDYDTLTALQQAVESMQSSAAIGIVQAISAAAQSALIFAAQSVQPLANIGSVSDALQLVYAKMVAASASLDHGTVPSMGAQTSATGVTPVGNPKILTSVVDSAGRSLQYSYPGEIITTTITADAQDGTTTAGQEPYSIVGQGANPNGPLAYDWLTSGKYGSGATLTGAIIDPTTSNTSTTVAAGSNLLVNGSFATQTTANNADNWGITAGTAGSTILGSTSGGYISGSSGYIELVSDGSTLLGIKQKFNTASSATVGAGGTPAVLLPSAVNGQQIGFVIAYKLSAGSPAAGVLTLDLADNGGTVIADDQSVNNSTTVDLTAVADTNWHVATLVARMPKTLPTSTPYAFRVYQSTAVTSGKNVFLSCAAAAVLQQLYPGGPFFELFRGSTDVKINDAWTNTLSYTPGKLQRAVWRHFNPPSVGNQTPGLMIPASGSPTIADSLVA